MGEGVWSHVLWNIVGVPTVLYCLLLWVENYTKGRCITLKVNLRLTTLKNETSVMLEIMKGDKTLIAVFVNLSPNLASSNWWNYL